MKKLRWRTLRLARLVHIKWRRSTELDWSVGSTIGSLKQPTHLFITTGTTAGTKDTSRGSTVWMRMSGRLVAGTGRVYLTPFPLLWVCTGASLNTGAGRRWAADAVHLFGADYVFQFLLTGVVVIKVQLLCWKLFMGLLDKAW
jgi:hypothetical protein